MFGGAASPQSSLSSLQILPPICRLLTPLLGLGPEQRSAVGILLGGVQAIKCGHDTVAISAMRTLRSFTSALSSYTVASPCFIFVAAIKQSCEYGYARHDR